MVAGNKGSNYRARQEADRREYGCSFASANTYTYTVWKQTGGIRRASMEYAGTNRCSDTSAYEAADQEVAQTVFVFHESDTANVLPRDGLSAGIVLVHDRGFCETHEGSGMLLRIGFDDLHPLPRR